MRIAVVGSGYVGLVAGACFADLGHDVILVDNDERKLTALKNGEVPIHEKFLPELLGRHRGNRLQFSSDLQAAVRASSAIFVAVGTPPTDRGDADLSYVESVAREITDAISINEYKVVVEKSTVPVYTSEWVRRIILRNGADPDSFDVASNPEFLREGTAVTDFLFPDRIVVGCDSERAAQVLREVYAPLTTGSYYDRSDAIPQPDRTSIPAPIIVTSTKSAELIKHASNAFLAMKISFINVVANLCEAVDADVEHVAKGMGMDNRIGKRFLSAGIGYGGSCFPKDVAAFRYVAQQLGIDFSLLEEVEKINELQKERFFQKIRSALWTLRKKRLGVLGLSFKGGTDDIRESPALEIIKMLLDAGASICAYVPAAIERAKIEMPPNEFLQYTDDPYAAADNADALLILTDWAEFTRLDLKKLRYTLRYPIVIDGRNLFDPWVMQDLGFTYLSVGRPSQHTSVESASTKRWP
jgi:UDPglucose 6-dehydrogenase